MKSEYISFLDELKEEPKQLSVNDRVLIVDGLNTFIRAHSVNPSLNDDGMHIGGLIGFLRSLRYSINLHQPSRCIIVFDGKGGSKKRRQIYPEYKANRKVKKRLNRNVDWGTAPADEEESMKMQLGRLVDYLEQLPVTLISVDNVEADDVMAYISKQILTDSKITLMSTDKDFLQLIDDRIKVWSPTKKKLYNDKAVFEEYGIHAFNFLTYRIMDGDKSDNIGGIKGAGLKSLIKFLPGISQDRKFTAKDLLEYVEKSDSKIKLLDNIKNSSILLKRNYLLMQLDDVDIPNHIKIKVQEAVSRDIPQLIKYRFQTMFLQDKLSNQIKNFDNWVTEFIRLDRIKGVNSGK
jgi:DNA polymerase-1